MSVYILISLNIKQGRGSNLSSVVQTSAVRLDLFNPSPPAAVSGETMSRQKGEQNVWSCIKPKDRRVSNPGVKVVGAGLGERRSERLSDRLSD